MTLLHSIIATKKREISSLPAFTPVRRTRASFIDAILKNRPGLIAEIKPKSPSEGNLIAREKIHELAGIYDHHAEAISVLCDRDYFGGGFDLLTEISKMTELPLLAKEFILDERQIDHACVNGASAVLLIAAILETQDLLRLASHAIDLDLDILLEVHTTEDVDKAINVFRALPKESRHQILIGINNRDLETRTIDFNVTMILAPILRKALPELRGIMSESGIGIREDCELLKPFVDGFLIGTSILQSKDPESFISHLQRKIHPKIKFCGMTREEDVSLAEGLRVNFIGLIFAAHSPRKITLATAKLLRPSIKNATVVGVFENNRPEEILQCIDELPLDMVQIYGDVPEEISVPVIRAFRGMPSTKILQEALDQYAYILLDKTEGKNIADFDAIAALPVGIRSRLFLAGGLTPQNVRALSDRIQPFAIDCARGIESDPGKKDHHRMLEFFKNLAEPSMPKRGRHGATCGGDCRAERRHDGDGKMKDLGKFGVFGGCYVSELLIPVLTDVEAAFLKFKDNPEFQGELSTMLKEFAGRPTPITEMKNLSREFGCTIVLKREDLLHGGAHKTNNVLGQAMLAKRMGKKHLIAETGAGQHGVATAMAGALMGLPVKIFMGAKDIERQHSNVQRMTLFGAEVIAVESGSQSLKDAINDALRYWTAHSRDTYYVFGTVAGPHPFPSLVAHFQRVIGDEARAQCLEKYAKLPHTVCACVGGGSNAIGIFKAFVDDPTVRLIGVEPAGEGLATGKHGAALGMGRPGSLHGSYSYCLQDDDGQIKEAHSISAGLDYPGVGPEHSFLKDIRRAEYVSATDQEAVDAFLLLTKKEGIIPALESSHAIAAARTIATSLKQDDILLINLSGRGDKDIDHVLRFLS